MGWVSLSLDSKDLALTVCFASMYAVLSTIPLFPVIGVVGKAFTVAVIIAPLVGLIIGPQRGALAASIGGFIGWSLAPQYGVLLQLSFVPGAATALCSGYLYNDKWKTLLIIYFLLFSAFAFYPTIGPMWLYPPFVWFHFLGLFFLISWAKLKTLKVSSNHSRITELSFRVGVISLIATLFGHAVGGLIFEATSPIFFPNVDWRGLWQSLIFLYPLERSIVVFISILIGAPLIKALRTHGFEVGGK